MNPIILCCVAPLALGCIMLVLFFEPIANAIVDVLIWLSQLGRP